MEIVVSGQRGNNRCPVCGLIRPYGNEDGFTECPNDICFVYGYPVPESFKTSLEVLTYLGWLPEKYHIGFLADGYRYFNPMLFRMKSIRKNPSITRTVF